MKANDWGIGVLFLLAALNVGSDLAHQSSTRRQKNRIETLEADSVRFDLALQSSRAAAGALHLQIDAFQSVDMQRCRDRTQCLRSTIDALIKVWPGRARAPDACGGWPAWPVPGENLDHATR